VSLDHATLDLLRQSHPARGLLRSDHAPLVASFLHCEFIVPNVRMLDESVIGVIAWRHTSPMGDERIKRAGLPRVIFVN
jgi:hypothetical protein